MSGLRFTYNSYIGRGSRIKLVEVADGNGNYSPIDESRVYSVVTNNFMRTGGDGYEIFANDAIEPYDHGRPITEVLIDYMIRKHPVTVVKDGRILDQ